MSGISSGIVRSGEVVSDIDKGPVKPIHFGKGTSCFSLKRDNDW